MSPTELVAALAKKSGLLWVEINGATHAVWHEWVGDAACIVVGGTEQPLPGIEDAQQVTLLLRSKTSRALVASAAATVERITTTSPHWDEVTSTLKSGRLNVENGDHAVERWAWESAVYRLVPTGDVSVADEIASDLPFTAPRLAR